MEKQQMRETQGCLTGAVNIFNEMLLGIGSFIGKGLSLSWKAVKAIFRFIGGKIIFPAGDLLYRLLRKILESIYNYILSPCWAGACKLTKLLFKVSKWLALTAINIVGWSIDKIFLGPPALRRFLRGGILPHDINWTVGQRFWVFENTGWDVFTSTHNGVIENIAGAILGFGLLVFPLYTLFSHGLKSVGSMIIHYWRVTNHKQGCADNPYSLVDSDNTSVRNVFVKRFFSCSYISYLVSCYCVD